MMFFVVAGFLAFLWLAAMLAWPSMYPDVFSWRSTLGYTLSMWGLIAVSMLLGWAVL